MEYASTHATLNIDKPQIVENSNNLGQIEIPAADGSNFPKEIDRQTVEIPLVQMVNDQLKKLPEFQKKKVILWEDNQQLINVASNNYTIIPHMQAVEAVRTAIQDFYGETPEVGVETFKEGARVKVTFEMPWVEPILFDQTGELINVNLTMFNSYDGGWAFKCLLSAFMFQGCNTALIGSNIGQIKMKHMPFMKDRSLGEKIDGLLKKSQEVKGIWDAWHNEILESEQIQQMADTVRGGNFSAKHLSPIVNNKVPRSKWAVYNEFLSIATHQVKSPSRREQYNTMISKMFY
jgi:hypothetical protein